MPYFLVKHETDNYDETVQAASRASGAIILDANMRYTMLLVHSQSALEEYRQAFIYLSSKEYDDDDIVYIQLHLKGYHFYLDYATPELKQKDLDAVEDRGYFVPKHCNGNIIAVTDRIASARNLRHAVGVPDERNDCKNISSTYVGRFEIDMHYVHAHCIETSLAMAVFVNPELFLSQIFQRGMRMDHTGQEIDNYKLP